MPPQTFVGGVVAYATDLKVSVLGVPREVVDGPGVVSSECATAMARGVRLLTGATYGVATTGVAGPTEQEGKPPGTVFVAVDGPDGGPTLALELPGGREQSRDPYLRRGAGRAARPAAQPDLRNLNLLPEETPLR